MAENADPVNQDVAGQQARWEPKTEADRAEVREQLGRVIASVLFRNSKRFPAFLQHTVEHALRSTDPLKERTIGHEVFSRAPGYDTNQDPVVRMTAAEVRKRLAQYYQQAAHEHELVIAYQPGSYVPDFVRPIRPPSGEDAVAAAIPAPAPAERSPVIGRWAVAAVLALAVVGISAVVIVTRKATAPDDDAVARFWKTILEANSPALICIGEPSSWQSRGIDPSPPRPEDLSISEFLRNNSVRYTDAVTLALIAGELRAKRKPFTIRRSEATDLKDLRDGPVILIGGFNNPWTLRLSEGLRFTLASDENGPYVRDRDNPDSRKWQRASGNLMRNVTGTYGIITRVRDPATGQTVLIISGLLLGTGTAGECLIDSECLQIAETMTTSGENRNIQIIVSASVIGQEAGAPQVVAVHTW